MKKSSTPIVMISLIVFSIFAQNQIPQEFSVSAHKGNLQLWSKESKKWVPITDFSQFKSGTTIAVRENSELQITFEPAIFLTVYQNSILTLNNMIKQPDKKIIRMNLTLQTGEAVLRMQSLISSTVLLSIETPAASISINNADVEFSVKQDITALQMLRGDARIKHSSFDVKSMIFEGSKATIYATKPVVEITSASETVASPADSTARPTIAILSIQSNKRNDNSVDQISDIVAENYQKTSNAKVLYLDDIRNLLKTEKLESLLNCFTDSCIAKISTHVGVDMVIMGNIGQVGSSYIFSLKMIDVLRDKTLKRISASVDSNLGLILDKIPGMVGELVSTQKFVTHNTNPIKSSNSKTFDKNGSVVWVKNGTFSMGIEDKEEFDALPMHHVNLEGFYMDKYEVTKEEFEKVMGNNPSSFRGCSNCPVDNVTWFEANEYCMKLGKRLPTEAEWEYACRAGTTTSFHYGNTLSSKQANFDGKSPYGGVPQDVFKAHPVLVGQYQPNDFGLYDMHGNVAEWCSDWYDPAYYGNSLDSNATGPDQGKLKVVRGGSWNNAGKTLRSGKRTAYNPTMRLNTIGFRCVKDEY